MDRCTKIVLAVAAALGALSLSGSAFASFCSKPDAPCCADRSGLFDDEDDFDRCKREMESYKDDVQTYTDCIVRQAKSDVSDAEREYNDAVESFNRRARQ